MKIKREHNQYYARYIERGIADVANGLPITNYEQFNFPNADVATMNGDIQILNEYLNTANIEYIGNHTANADGDLLVDNEVVELKYTDGSLGTYFNTSTEYMRNINFPTYTEYLRAEGYFDALRAMGVEVSNTNVSPVSIDTSKHIRHEQAEMYANIVSIEKAHRIAYVAWLFDYLKNNTDARLQFIKDLITKQASNKSMPDRLIVFNHNTKWVREFTKSDILDCINNNTLKLSGGTIKMCGAHFTIAWQNGTGLNNPTIRVFLEG